MNPAVTPRTGLPLILLGAGGHARVLHALAVAAGQTVIGLCDPGLVGLGQTRWHGVPVLGGDDALSEFDPATVGLLNGLGQQVASRARQRLYQQMREAGFRFPALVHPTAWVAPGVELADGVQVMAGAVVQPGSCLGENCIVNTRAGIDHDCVLGAHVHVAPGAVLCGGVQVGSGAFIGAGAVVAHGLEVGADAVLGAGTTLVRPLAAGRTCLGAANRLQPLHDVAHISDLN